MNKPRQNTTKKQGTNIWGMIRDIMVTSMNKGQFPLTAVFSVLVIILIKMPPEDVSQFMFTLILKFEDGYILGWVLFSLVVIGWYFNTRIIRKAHYIEMQRISEEKKYLQGKNTNKKVLSSNSKNI